MGSMRDRVAIVTGGSVGIGRAAALAARGKAPTSRSAMCRSIRVSTSSRRSNGRGEGVVRCDGRLEGRRPSAHRRNGYPIRPPRLRVQQRRYRRAAGTDRRVHGAELESDDGHNLTGVWLYARGDSAHARERRRRDRQQLVGRRPRRVSDDAGLRRLQARRHRAHEDGRTRLRLVASA